MIRSAAAAALLASVALLAGCKSVTPAPTAAAGKVTYVGGRWSDLPGWDADAVSQSWPALLASCRVPGRPQWQDVCSAATALAPVTDASVRAFFSQRFQPLRIVRAGAGVAQTTGLLTGYFEPQLHGARSHIAGFDTPLYSPPEDLLTVDLSSIVPELKGRRIRGRLVGKTVIPYFARADLQNDPLLAGHEVVWLQDALEAFLLEVQGSGRVQLLDGTIIRLGYSDQNGQPYRSIGRYLVGLGELSVEQASVPGIRQWLAVHPQRLREVLDANPSVVFFKELPLGDPNLGPRGAEGIALTPGRSIAVDPGFIPLGSPVYLSTGADKTLQRLVIAQDTGGAINGAPRADYFCGTGEAAAQLAGTLRAQASLWLLWPRDVPLPGSAAGPH